MIEKLRRNNLSKDLKKFWPLTVNIELLLILYVIIVMVYLCPFKAR